MTNLEILKKLRRLHTLLVLGKRSNNLALALRKAIETIAAWHQTAEEVIARTPVRQLFAGYGPKFIKLFDELMQTGDIAMIGQLQPEFDPFFCYLCEIPGIGETMARRMFFDRSIHSMDDLRIAYTNNVLQRIPAFGDARLKAIEDVLWQTQDHHYWEKPSEESDTAESIVESVDAIRTAVNVPESPAPEPASSQLDLFALASPLASSPDSHAKGDGVRQVSLVSSPNSHAKGDGARQVSLASSPDSHAKGDGERQGSRAGVLFNDANDAENAGFADDDEALARALQQAMEVRPPRDEQLELELGAVIARDLADHGITSDVDEKPSSAMASKPVPPESPFVFLDKEERENDESCRNAGECVKGACIRAGFIRADVVVADVIHAKVVRGSRIIFEPQRCYGSNEDAVTLDEIHAHRVEADEIYVDGLSAREIHIHCMAAGTLVYAPYDHP